MAIKYECDRCYEQFDSEVSLYKVTVQDQNIRGMSDEWDVCPSCRRVILDAINTRPAKAK